MYKNHEITKKDESKIRSFLEIVGLILIVFLIRTFGFGLYEVPTGSMETTMLVGERFFADKFTVLFSKPKHGNVISFNEPQYPYSTNWLVRLWQHYIWGPNNWTKRIIGEPGDIIKGVIEDGKSVIYRNGKKLDEPYINKYPLITIWRVNPLKLHEMMRKEFAAISSQALLEKLAAQVFCNSHEMRSYDPSVSYDNQPFYRIRPNYIVRTDEHGVFSFGTGGKSLMRYPDVPDYARPDRVTRKGNTYWSGSDEFYAELGDNEYWLMGDNRKGSYDSRFFGPVKSALIHGKILFRILSVRPSEAELSLKESSGGRLWQTFTWIKSFLLVDIILHPIDFWRRVRWNRCFQCIH